MINTIIHKIALTCKKATLLLEVQDEELNNPIQKLRLRLHLKICKACSIYQKKRLTIDRILRKQYAGEINALKDNATNDPADIEKLKEKIINNLPHSEQ